MKSKTVETVIEHLKKVSNDYIVCASKSKNDELKTCALTSMTKHVTFRVGRVDPDRFTQAELAMGRINPNPS